MIWFVDEWRLLARSAAPPPRWEPKREQQQTPSSSGKAAAPAPPARGQRSGHPPAILWGPPFFLLYLSGKRLGLLHELVPKATIMGFLVNPNNPVEELETTNAEAAARALGVRLQVFKATNEREIDAAFTTILERRIGALVVGSDPFLLG